MNYNFALSLVFTISQFWQDVQLVRWRLKMAMSGNIGVTAGINTLFCCVPPWICLPMPSTINDKICFPKMIPQGFEKKSCAFMLICSKFVDLEW